MKSGVQEIHICWDLKAPSMALRRIFREMFSSILGPVHLARALSLTGRYPPAPMSLENPVEPGGFGLECSWV